MGLDPDPDPDPAPGKNTRSQSCLPYKRGGVELNLFSRRILREQDR